MMFKKLLDGLAAIQTYMSGTLFLVIFSINTMEIISRTFFNHSFLWVTDISTICIVWMIMLGMAVGVYQKEHIVLDLLISRFPHRNVPATKAAERVKKVRLENRVPLVIFTLTRVLQICMRKSRTCAPNTL